MIVFAVTGNPGSGKSSLLKHLAEDLAEYSVPCAGFVLPAGDRDEEGLGAAWYEFLEVEACSTLAGPCLKQHGTAASRKREGGYEWAPEFFSNCRKIIAAAPATGALVVDEFGSQETRGAGHLPALLELKASATRPWVVLLAVRSGCVDQLEAATGLPVGYCVDLNETELNSARSAALSFLLSVLR